MHCALQSFAASWGGSLVKAKHTAAVEEIDDAPVTVSTMRGVTSEAAFLDLPANKLPKGAREQSVDRVPRMRMRRGNRGARKALAPGTAGWPRENAGGAVHPRPTLLPRGGSGRVREAAKPARHCINCSGDRAEVRANSWEKRRKRLH